MGKSSKSYHLDREFWDIQVGNDGFTTVTSKKSGRKYYAHLEDGKVMYVPGTNFISIPMYVRNELQYKAKSFVLEVPNGSVN